MDASGWQDIPDELFEDLILKICTRCSEEKPESEFYFRPSQGNYASICKPCMTEYLREWRKHNKERYRAISRKSNEKYRLRKINGT